MSFANAIDLIAKATLLLALSLVLDSLMRRRWTLLTSTIWNCILLALVVLPLAESLAPTTVIRILPIRAITDAPPVRSVVRKLEGDPGRATRDHVIKSIGKEGGAEVASTDKLTDETPLDTSETARAINWIAVFTGYTNWPILLSCVFFIGLTLALVRLAASWWLVNRLRRRAAPVESSLWQGRPQAWQSQLASSRTSSRLQIRLLRSGEVVAPLALGIRRRAIIIPTAMAANADVATIDATLVHEMAHFVRADSFWLAVQRIVEALLWFHPLIWIARGRIAFIRERACDDFAVHALGGRERYVDVLLKIAALSRTPTEFGLSMAIVRRGSLERRLGALEHSEGSSQCDTSSTTGRVVACAAVVGTFILASLSLQPATAQQATIHVDDSSNVPLIDDSATSDENPAANDQRRVPSVQDAIARYTQNVAGIRAYDVQMTQTMMIPMKSVVVDAKKEDQPSVTKAMEWRPLEAGEEPKSHASSVRQVRVADGRRRFEIERTSPRVTKDTVVDDGRQLRALIDGKQGSIRKTGGFRLQDYEEYRTYLGDVMGPVSLVNLVQDRAGTELIESTESDAGLVGLRLPTGNGTLLKPWEFRVWLDPQHGSLPAKVETFQQDGAELHLKRRTLIKRFHEPQPGVWVPVEMILTAYNVQAGRWRGLPVNVSHVLVDTERSRWNEDLPDELFVLRYPPGVPVTDEINELRFTTGEGDDGNDLRSLAEHASDKIKIHMARPLKRVELTQVRERDRDAAEKLQKYLAELKLNEHGAITEVTVSVRWKSPPGLQGPNIDDAGLAYLENLDELELLGLGNTQVTDQGLVHLRGLTRLKTLYLTNTNITDDGMRNLASLVNLETLALENNQIKDGERQRFVKITDRALAILQPLEKLSHLQLMGTEITDAGLEHLKAFPNLKQVSLVGSAVTREGAERFRKAKPGVNISVD